MHRCENYSDMASLMQPQKYHTTNCSHWEELNHQKCDKVKKYKQDKFGPKLKQSNKKAKKIECPFDLKEMKEFLKCHTHLEKAKKTLNNIKWHMDEVQFQVKK
jgi:hypothetical protein